MSARTSYRISLIAGLLVIALTVYSAIQPPVPVCGKLDKSYTPIIAFELVRSTPDLHAIFGAAPGACRTAIAARMDFINTIDSFPFIPLYGAFLFFFFLARRPSGLANLGAVLVVLACLADYVENYALFHLSAAPDTPGQWLTLLIWATETKWVGLGITNALGGLLLWNARNPLSYLALLPCLVGTAASLVSIMAPAKVGPALSNAIALGWLVFLIVAARESFRSSRAAA